MNQAPFPFAVLALLQPQAAAIRMLAGRGVANFDCRQRVQHADQLLIPFCFPLHSGDRLRQKIAPDLRTYQKHPVLLKTCYRDRTDDNIRYREIDAFKAPSEPPDPTGVDEKTGFSRGFTYATGCCAESGSGSAIGPNATAHRAKKRLHRPWVTAMHSV